jgi:uncharacterized protein YodC (DUF2158 family)
MFKPGDVVSLNSGGSLMTVTHVSTIFSGGIEVVSDVMTTWIAVDGTQQQGGFKVEWLKHAESSGK